MDESLRAAVLGKADKRTVVIGEGKLWPNATVPFEFDKRIGNYSYFQKLYVTCGVHLCSQLIVDTIAIASLHIKLYKMFVTIAI